MLASQFLLRGSWITVTTMNRRHNKDGKDYTTIWPNGTPNCPLLSSRCWRHLPTLLSLLATYYLLTMFTVCGTEKPRICAPDFILTSIVAASHQYYCLAKQLLINHTPNYEEHVTLPQGLSSSEPAVSFQQKAPLNQANQQAETIDLLRRACAVAESHTNTMGIVLMSTLPILACKYHPRLPIQHRHLEPC